MNSVNQVTLVGNVGKDPEIKNAQSGQVIANLSIATSESWTDKGSGEKKEKTEWHKVVVFGKLAEVVQRYVKKGDKLYLQGKLQTRKWQDQSGADRYSTEVVLNTFGSTLVMLSQRGNGAAEPAKAIEPKGGSYAEELNDEIPF